MVDRIFSLYKYSWELDPYEVLKLARHQLLSNYDSKTKQQSLQELELFLNECYYPKHNNPIGQQIANTMANAREQFIKQELEKQNRNIENYLSKQTIKDILSSIDKTKYVGEKRKEQGTRTKMQINTFLIRKQQIQAVLNRIIGDEVLSKDNEKLIEESKDLLRDMKFAMREMFPGVEHNESLWNKMIMAKDNESLKNLLNNIDTVYNSLMAGANLQEIIGRAFELEQIAMQEIYNAGIKNLAQKNIQDIFRYLYDIPKASLYGSKNVSRNNTSLNGILSIDTVFPSEADFQKYISDNLYFFNEQTKIPNEKYEVKIGDEIINISTHLAEKQGKVDFIYQTNADAIYASLKRWNGSFQDHTFGSTDLFGAILRSYDIDAPFSYGLVIGYYGKLKRLGGEYQNNTNNLHLFAKACLLIDTLIGLSQKKGNMADALVINTGQKILIFSMNDIIKKVQDDIFLLDKFTVKGLTKFDNSQIEEKLMFSQSQVNRTSLSALHAQMTKLKLGISAQILQ